MKREISRRYITGIIGAIILGSIACIPLVYIYIYKATFLAMLTILVPIGAIYGYSLFRGKINKNAKLINLIVTIVIIAVAFLIVIPIFTLKFANYRVTFNTLKQLYTYNEFKLIVFRNLIISEVFAILGSILISIKLKYQLIDFKSKKDNKINLLEEKDLIELKQESIKVLKPIFEKYNATSKDETIFSEEVFAEVKDKNARQYFSYLKDLKIIKKYKNKFFYEEENEKNTKTRKRSLEGGIAIVVAILIGVMVISVTQIEQGDIITAWDENIKFDISTEWSTLETYNKETGWSYYKYISNEDSAKKTENLSETDYPAIIQVYYDTENETQTIDKMKESMDQYFKEKLLPDVYYIENSTTSNGYGEIKAKLQFLNEDNVETEFLYYIIQDNKIAYITGITYNQSDNDKLEQYLENIANSVHWEK